MNGDGADFRTVRMRLRRFPADPALQNYVHVEGCDTSGNLVRSGRNQQLEITEIWLEIRNQDPVEIRKSARNHKKSSRNNEKHPLFV